MTGVAPQILESRNAVGCGLRVTFLWNRDRYAHTVSALDGDRLVPLLASTDCCGVATDWPTSPPLQQLSVETRDDGSLVALLVGMAGRNHWSASVQEKKNEAAFHFDIALRTNALPTFAGSSYRSMVQASFRDARIAEVAINGICCEFVADAQASTLETNADYFSLRCLDEPTRFPATLRWQYYLRLA